MEVNKQRHCLQNKNAKYILYNAKKTMRQNEACMKGGRTKHKNNIQLLLLKWNDRLTDL